MFWRKKPVSPIEPASPGICQCGHLRCFHEQATGRCHVGYPKNSKWPNGSQCACQIFILDPNADIDDDDDDDDRPEDYPTPSPTELEKIFNS